MSEKPEKIDPALIEAARRRGYEDDNTSLRAVVWFCVCLGVAGVVIHLAMAWLFSAFDERSLALDQPPSPLKAEQPAVEGYQHWTREGIDLDRLRVEEAAALHQGRIVDAQQGIAQLPIERAMALVVAREQARWARESGAPASPALAEEPAGRTPQSLQESNGPETPATPPDAGSDAGPVHP